MDADALDFWLGTWACTWDGGHGTNTITREFDGRVVQERFEAIEPEPFSGLSVSVHGGDTRRQTWVDSSGSYWAFVGEQEGDTVVFVTPTPVDADQVFTDGLLPHRRQRLRLATGVLPGPSQLGALLGAPLSPARAFLIQLA